MTSFGTWKINTYIIWYSFNTLFCPLFLHCLHLNSFLEFKRIQRVLRICKCFSDYFWKLIFIIRHLRKKIVATATTIFYIIIHVILLARREFQSPVVYNKLHNLLFSKTLMEIKSLTNLKCNYWEKTKNCCSFIEDSLYLVNSNGKLEEFADE